MGTRRLTFRGAGGADLVARLDLPPDGEPRGYALFAHCFTCSKDLKAAVNVGRALNAHGIGVLRFDFTGLGESEGDFADTDFSSNVDDLLAAAAFMEEEFSAPRIMIGHSLGGAAAILAASQIDDVRAVATIGAPHDPEHVRNLFAEAEPEIRERGRAKVRLEGREFTITEQFLDDIAAQHVDEVLGSLKRALLVLHSPVDTVVGIENAAAIFKAAKHPKSFVSLDTADHLLTDESDSRYAGNVIAAWAGRYAELRPAPTVEDLKSGSRVAVRLGADGFRTEVMAGGHGLVADEPKSVGGTDQGPTPYDLLAAALGTCTAMTLRMYADRKKWPLEGVEVGVSHTKVHAEDEADPDGESAKLDRLERVVYVSGDLDQEQRRRLLEIADRCPVHKTLEAGVKIVTEAGED